MDFDPITGQPTPAQQAQPAAPTAPAGPAPDMQTAFPPIGEPDPVVTPTAPALSTDEQWQQRLEQQNQQWQQRFDSLTQTLAMQQRFPQQPQSAQPAQPAQQPAAVTFADLPDAVQNPSEFNRVLGERLQQAFQASSQQSASAQAQLMDQQARANAINGVWSTIQSRHPDLAARAALVQGAAAVEFGALRAQGIDPVAIAQGNPESLVGRIVQRMQQELGMPTGQPTQPAGYPMQQPMGYPMQGAARTAGIATASTTMPTAPAAPQATGFIEQLRKAQLDSGLI